MPRVLFGLYSDSRLFLPSGQGGRAGTVECKVYEDDGFVTVHMSFENESGLDQPNVYWRWYHEQYDFMDLHPVLSNPIVTGNGVWEEDRCYPDYDGYELGTIPAGEIWEVKVEWEGYGVYWHHTYRQDVSTAYVLIHEVSVATAMFISREEPWVFPKGDCDLDGDVDLDDFARLKKNFGEIGGWWHGDFNHDNRVNIDDFAILKGNFGT